VGALPPIFIEFLGNAGGFHATADAVKADLAEVETEGGSNLEKLSSVSQAAFLGVGAAAILAGGKAVEMAANFQSQMTRVQTGAGEAQSNMKLVSSGILAMAGQVGQSTEQLTSGLYTVESAGYHGADALNVLKVAAMGAKVGAADLPTVTDAVTTALNAYSLKASDATGVMNALVATEAAGKTNMEALAGSMSSILPVASAAHVGLNEILGAMATMTSQGTSADVAATYLKQTIGQLSNPSAKAAQEMAGLGLNATQVAQNLGKNGLASTLNELTDAIQSKMGPAGTVVISTLQKAASNTTDYQKALANLKPDQQTYIGALADMVGGTKSMMAALELTGPHMATFQQNTADIAQHVKAGGNSIEGWAAVQGTFNQRVSEAKGSLEAMGIVIGQKLMPVATKLLDWFSTSVTWILKHKIAMEALGGAIAGILVVGLQAAAIAAQEFTIALLANPVTWLVLAVMALGAAIVLLATHWKTVWAFIKGITADVVNWLISAWHWVAGETAGAWRDISGAVVGAWHSIERFFESAWHTVADKVVGAWHWIEEKTDEAWKLGVVMPVTVAWRMLEGFLSSAWHAVADPIVGAWHWISRETLAVWNSISAFFKKWWPLLLIIFAAPIGILLAAWNHFHKQAEAGARAVWGAISGFFVATWRDISRAADDAWSAIESYIISPIERAWAWLVSTWNSAVAWLSAVWTDISNDAQAAWTWLGNEAEAAWKLVVQYIVSPLEQCWAWISRLWSEAESWLSSTWGRIERDASAAWNSVVHAITDPLDRAWAELSSGVSHVGETLWNGLVAAWHEIENVGKWFEGIGSSIVEGIIHGVEGAAGSLFGSLKNLANSALSSAKSFLGINSPSRVFAQEVGQWIPHGIAVGIQEHAGVAASAVAAMAGGTLGQFGTVGGLEPALAGGAGSAGGIGPAGAQTVVNVTVQGSVTADRDLATTIQRVMGQYGSRNSATYQPYRR
jgi:TP901 family phage tail tape measure protein